MSRRPTPTLGSALVTAGVAAATTWVSLLSWRGFTDRPEGFLVPLVVLGAVVAGVGALGRWGRLGVGAVLLLQVLVGGMVASYAVGGSPLPVGAAWTDLRTAVDLAVVGAETFPPPVPSEEADVAPLLIGGGLLCLVLVDLLAGGLRRTSLAGLPLLTIYSLPVGLVGTDLTWWVFAMSALGFLLLLFRQEAASVGRWGRALDGADRTVLGDGLQSAGVRLSATAIALSATTLGVVVPLAVPTLDVRLFDVGRGAGGGAGVDIENPMVDLRRDLNRGQDVPLLRMRTDDPDPSYLRISVLTRFTANEWSSGDRQIPAGNLPDGQLPDLVGVAADVPRRTFDYELEALPDLRSTWLPTMSPVSAVRAEGDWRYDAATMDFLAADEGLDTAGLRWSMTGVDLDLSAQELADASAAAGQVSADFTDLPPGMPPVIRQLANDVTAGLPTRFQKAVALQDWFRENFTYSLEDVPPGNGSDDLVAFLGTEEGGRTGYCEQFAAAMAVMARQLGIPARVAVGFLVPDEIQDGVFEYSAYDLHAWPELFIAGSGWVRFEPTPADRAEGVPNYTRQAVDGPGAQPLDPGGRPGDDLADPGGQAADGPDEEPTTAPDPVAEDAAGTGGAPDWVRPVLVTAGVVGLVVLLALLPGAWRRRRREARLAGGPEQVWVELRDTALDLGVPWSPGRSPRATAAGLREHLLGPVGPAGPFVALDLLVDTLERLRYSRSSEIGAGTGADTQAAGRAVLEALVAGVEPGARRRAAWWPKTLLRPTRAVEATTASDQPDLVDHAR